MAKNGTRDKWIGLVGQFERSSQTTREFALEHGLNPRTLTWWKSALRRETRKVEFLDVTVTADVPPFVLHLGVCKVEVPRGFDSDDLRRLVAVLGARC
jgi:hypothetical protein